VESFEVSPIGYVSCSQFYRYQQPRQGVFAQNRGVIELKRGQNFEQGLHDLSGFSHIWVIYLFHLNETWNPKVAPPVNPDGKKKGVFATRAPHRPNRMGMSCVELVDVETHTRRLHIRNFDILDKTPVLDIKPYIPEADSFPQAQRGWLPDTQEMWEILFMPLFLRQAEWIRQHTGYDLAEFCRIQLSYAPLDDARKRIEPVSRSRYFIRFRTWKAGFECLEGERKIQLCCIESNYSPHELTSVEDIYKDKSYHISFRREFPHRFFSEI
jgi:tRNA-Thr(GGU) m(6)t(6)A37 methyltransferase TsaA